MSRETADARQENRFQRWFRETRAELAKVSWPTRQEGLRLTGIVIVVTIISALVIFAVDSFFSTIVGLIIGAG
ncbi:MAG: preprotein translocase subunit SecE [Caldilineaceae bacterium]